MKRGRWSSLAQDRSDRFALATAALLLLATALGGGGADGPLASGIVEAAAIVLLIARVSAHFRGQPLPDEALPPILLLCFALLIFGAHLLPLPPDIWMNLPGRQLPAQVAGAVGLGSEWRPLSLDPEATRRSAAALVVPAAILVSTLGASWNGLLLILRALVCGALLSALFGAVQLATGATVNFYGETLGGAASGLFANPNHQAQFLLLGIVVSGLLARLEAPHIRLRGRVGEVRMHLGWLVVPFLAVATIATGSRAGVILLAPAVFAAALIGVKGRRPIHLLAILVAGLLALLLAYLLTPPKVAEELNVSALLGEERLISVPDLLYTMGQHCPVGSGLGTFVPVHQMNENLDLVVRARVNHAHNDYIEFLIETGAAGAILLSILAVALTWRAWRLIRVTRSAEPGPALAGLTMLALLGIHSLVDYPARMSSIAAAAAVALAIAFSGVRREIVAEPRSRRRSRRKGFAMPALAQQASAR